MAFLRRSDVVIIACYLIAVISLNSAFGQEATFEKEIKLLKIGDTIPEELWNLPLQVVNHPEGKDVITLNDYRDKLIILDFWATWCGSCIAAFPNLNDLQLRLHNEIAVIPVTSQSEDLIGKFMKDNMVLRNNILPLVVDDKGQHSLQQYFPSKLLPHIVVLGNKELLAITHSLTMNEADVQSLLSGRVDHLVFKNDNMEYKLREPLLGGDNAANPNMYIARAILTEQIPGIPDGMLYFKKNNGNRTHFKATNIPLGTIWYFLNTGKAYIPPGLVGYPEAYTALIDSLFCYEVALPLERSDDIKEAFNHTLNNIFGLKGQLVFRDVNCLVLKKAPESFVSDDYNFPITIPARNFQGLSALAFATWINHLKPGTLHVVSDLEDTVNLIDGKLPRSNNLKELNDWLRRSGLILTMETRNFEFVVFSSSN